MPKKDFKASARASVASVFITDAKDTARNTDGTDNTDNAYTQDAHTDNTDNAHMRELSATKKEKRLNLLIYPALHKSLKKIAFIRQTSVNDLINTALQEFVEQNKKDLERYAAFIGTDSEANG